MCIGTPTMPRGNSKRKPTKRWEEIFGGSGFSSSARLLNPGPCFSLSVPASSATVGIEILALKQRTLPHHGTSQVPRWNGAASAQTPTCVLNHWRIRRGFDNLGRCHYDCALGNSTKFQQSLFKSDAGSSPILRITSKMPVNMFFPEPAELRCVCVCVCVFARAVWICRCKTFTW